MIQTGMIYMAECPEGRRYIGQTRCSLDYRAKKHEHRAASGSRLRFHEAVRLYGDAIKYEVVISGVPCHLLNALERMAISIYGTRVTGYNVAPGGVGGDTGVMTEDGRRRQLEHLRRVCHNNKGRVQSEEEKKNRSDSMKLARQRKSWSTKKRDA
jgi:hypothetical protein